MKKIILLSHYFHPCTLTPAQRISYWAAHFYRLGYYPIVVTRAWISDLKTHQDTKMPLGKDVVVERFSHYEVHYLPFRPGMLDRAYLWFGEGALRPLFLIAKLLDVFLVRFTLVFTSFSNLLPYLSRLIHSETPSKILISGEPFYLFRIGYQMNRAHGTPWIADYRDDWTTNELQMQKNGGAVRRMIAKLESSYERKWVATAQAVVSVSDIYTRRIADFLDKRGVTVQNGFEESLLARPELPPFEDFTVIYSGVLYPSQDISIIVGVLDRCFQAGTPFQLLFLGAGFDVKEKNRVEGMVPDHLKPYVRVTARVPRAEALDLLQRSQVVLATAYGQMKGIPSSKLYEYLALAKPILLCPSDGDVMEELATDAGLGFVANSVDEGVK